MQRNIKDLVEMFYNTEDKELKTDIVVQSYGDGKLKEFHNEVIKYFKKKDKENRRYYYLITFTLKAKNIPSKEEQDSYEQYIFYRLRAPALHIEKCHLVKEYTKKGMPHWHASVKAKRFIAKDRFKKWQKKFGFIDISKNHSHQYESIYEYISKIGYPIPLHGAETS